MNPLPEGYTEARQQLHTLIEWLLAGPQHERSGTIRLAVAPGLITTVASPHVTLSPRGVTVGDTTQPLLGTVASIGDAVGLTARRPNLQYRDQVPGGADTEISANPGAVAEVLAGLAGGLAPLAEISGDRPILWPEHFDVAIRSDDVNYGISPGDSFSEHPYAYVGPDRTDTNPFWNAPFGAALPFTPGDVGLSARISEFFRTGRLLAGLARA